MRKINHILSLSALLLLSTACGIDKLPDTDIASPETSAGDNSGTKSMVITASIGSPDTRIAYTPDGEDIPGLKAEWEPGDKLGVFYCDFRAVEGRVVGKYYYPPFLSAPGIDAPYDYNVEILSLTNVSPTTGAQATFSGNIPVDLQSRGFLFYYPLVSEVGRIDMYYTDIYRGETTATKLLEFTFSLTGQTVTIGTDGEIADHTLADYDLMSSFTGFKGSLEEYTEKTSANKVTYADGEVVQLQHLCALVSFDMPSVGVPVERIELRYGQNCFANSITFDYRMSRWAKTKTVGIDVIDNSDGSGRVKGYMTVSADAGVTGPFRIFVKGEDGSLWHSNELHIQNTNGMEAGKCYTFKPTLKPPKFAAGNIYWDGDQLTFDKYEQTDSDDDAVYFKWGSLIGISADGEAIDSDTEIYVPIHSQPGQYAAKTFHDQFGDYGGIPGFDGEEFEYDQPTNNALLYVWGKENNYWSENDNDPKTGMRRNWYQGDICAFITQGKWRMPTKEDFLTSKPYSINDENETITSYDGLYTFKSLDFRYARTGELIGMGDGGYYWSGSVVKDNSKRSCMLYFDASDDIADAGDTDDRQQAFPVRCVLNVVDDD